MTNFFIFTVNASMITMNSPMVCLATPYKLQAKLYTQALLDLDHLVQEARKNNYPLVIFSSIVDSLNVNCLPTITQEATKLSFLFF